MQLMLLEQQNKKKLMMAREEQDSWGVAMASGKGSPEGPSARKTRLPLQYQTDLSSQLRSANLRASLPHPTADEMSHDPGPRQSFDKPMLGHEELNGHSGKQLGAIADYLGIPEHAASSPAAMQAYIFDLKSRVTVPKLSKGPLNIHRVFDDENDSYRTYLDPPQWVEGETGPMEALIGTLPISNVQAYITKHPEFSFIVCRKYESTPPVDAEDVDVRAKHYSESIVPVEWHLATAMSKFAAFSDGEYGSDDSRYDCSVEEFEEFTNDWLEDGDVISLSSPYLPIYHTRGDTLDAFISTLKGMELLLFQRVADYILREYEAEYGIVDGLLARNKITHGYLDYLFKPGIVVVHGEGMDARGYTCTSWLRSSQKESHDTSEEFPPRSTIDRHYLANAMGISGASPESLQKTKEIVRRYTVKAWYWKFDGRFSKGHLDLAMHDIATNDRFEKDINDLEVRPLDYVDSKTLARLLNRGEWAWKCRKRRMIVYHEDADKKLHHAPGERFMVDMMTFNELHSSNLLDARDRKGPKDNTNLVGPESMEADTPPDETFVYLAPLSIRGFNLKTKKWRDIFIDGFSEVQWNTDAFKSLVLNEKTKRLIQALISNQIEAEMSTDIISGKGNGLIMLLHGGPGTGKTMTAESVAEIARKPLYPVTCGDIGTEPRDVEKYLESVLHLGKTWGCVVLLNEADVFLEQRSLEDLKRNALVSVFLRVLEYYDGILILTSNRVGTFDEAFKSRIQLAIHYTSLTLVQRTRVWDNFLKRLEKLGEEGIDFVDLKDNVEDLARHKMNGREIRNAITTARQYSRWERKQNGESFVLDHRVMEEIIETSGRFDKYLEKLNNGMSQDELATDEGLR